VTFYDLVDQTIELLRQRGRLSYRALKRQFELDDAQLDDLRFELIEVQRVAADEGGALECSANLEAIGHLEKGMQLLAMLPETPGRVEQELKLQISLGAALLIAKGYGAPEVKAAYSRARELSQRGGNPAQVFPTLLGLWRSSVVESRLRTSRELAEQLLELGQRAEEPSLLAVAHSTLGLTLTLLGEWATARLHLETGRDLYNADHRHSYVYVFGAHDPGVARLAYLGRTLWHLGYPQQALMASQDSVALARKVSHPYALGFALVFASRVHQLRRDSVATQELAEEAIALSTERGFPHWVAIGTILRGWAVAMREPGPQAIAQIEQSIEAWRGTGIGSSQSYWLGLLAEAYKRLGQPREGLTVLAEALDRVEETGERWWEAELHRAPGRIARRDEGRHTASGSDAGKMFSSGARDCPPPASQVAGAAGRVEPGAAVAEPRPRRGALRPRRAHLRCVHRRVRHRRSAGGEATAERRAIARGVTAYRGLPITAV